MFRGLSGVYTPKAVAVNREATSKAKPVVSGNRFGTTMRRAWVQMRT
jgi:hypothetical protein